MEEEFKQFQVIDKIKTWEKDYTCSSYNPVTEQLTTDRNDESFIATSVSAQKGQPRSLYFTQTFLQEIADTCIEFAHIFITDKVMYIKDISRLTTTPFNSLIFYLDREPLKSKETTTEIMNRYFEAKLIPYDYIKFAGRCIGIQKCCPYVSSDSAFVPEKGPSNAPVSWYAMHHVVYAEKDKQSHVTFLHFRNHQEFVLDLGKKGYEKQLENVMNLYTLHHLAKKRMMIEYHLVESPTIEQELNVIQRHMHIATPIHLEPNYAHRFFNYLAYFKMKELLTKILGEENPYIEEVMEPFKKPPFRFRFTK